MESTVSQVDYMKHRSRVAARCLLSKCYRDTNQLPPESVEDALADIIERQINLLSIIENIKSTGVLDAGDLRKIEDILAAN